MKPDVQPVPSAAKASPATKGDTIFAASLFNVGARSWEALVNLGTVPVLLAHLGTEAYGLIGFTQTVFGLLGLLDFGLSNAVNRELAKREVDAQGNRVVQMLVRSLEWPVLGVAVVLALIFLALASPVATHFLQVQALSPEKVVIVLQLFSGIFVFRWVAGFYRGVFFGLERQIQYNVVSVVYTTVRFVGGAALLASGALGIVGLFVWYLGSDALFFAVLRLQILSFERAGSRSGPSVSLARLREVLPYAMGTMGLAVVGVLGTQVDKLLVARLRPLIELGAYSFAFSLAMGIRIIPGAIWTAAFPRLVFARQTQNSPLATEVLTAAFRASTVSALALAAPLAIFAPDIVATVGGRTEGILQAAPLLALLAIAVFVESLNGPCYQQLLADGHSRALLGIFLGSNLVFFVAVAIAVSLWGVIGAALCWPLLQLASFLLLVRKARQLGGPNFAGALLSLVPAYSAVIGATAVARFLSAGSGIWVGTGIAAGVGAVSHLILGWRARTHRTAPALPGLG